MKTELTTPLKGPRPVINLRSFLILLFSSTLAFASPVPPPRFTGPDADVKEVKMYYEQFYGIVENSCLAGQVVQPIQIGFSDTLAKDLQAPNLIAVCYPNAVIIQINTPAWNRLSATSRKSVIYHELTHCVLRQEHVNDPTSYMNPYEDVRGQKDLETQVLNVINGICDKIERGSDRNGP